MVLNTYITSRDTGIGYHDQDYREPGRVLFEGTFQFNDQVGILITIGYGQEHLKSSRKYSL